MLKVCFNSLQSKQNPMEHQMSYFKVDQALEVEMTTAQAIAEMMNVWNLIYAATQEKMPSASPEQVYQVAKSAMNSSLGVTS